jgi:hypothetical protein
MPWMQYSSEGIGDSATTYFIAKFPKRKQWALGVDDGQVFSIAAYFRTENEARRFAATFDLKISEHED